MATVVSKDGTRIAFDRAGSGPAVILVDGAMCSRAFGPMPKVAALLAERFTVITYDRRGRGESGDTAPYAVTREIEDLDALIREAGGSAFVLALSSGGVLALEAAARGLAIPKLAIFEPPFVVDSTGHRPPADHQEQLARLIAADRRGDALKFFITKVIGMPAIAVVAMRFLPMWSTLKSIAPTLAYDAAIMGDYSLPAARIRSIATPTLVIGGSKSQTLLRRAVEAVAGALPNATLRTLAGQTHNVAPKVLAPVVAEFFAAEAPARRESLAHALA